MIVKEIAEEEEVVKKRRNEHQVKFNEGGELPVSITPCLQPATDLRPPQTLLCQKGYEEHHYRTL